MRPAHDWMYVNVNATHVTADATALRLPAREEAENAGPSPKMGENGPQAQQVR